MKKLFPVLALLAVVGMVLVSGCSQSNDTPKPPADAPAAPSTNAPAAK
jgi:hypothetical protein